MTLAELIEHVGCENIKVQALSANIKAVHAARKGKDAEITFITSDEMALDLACGGERYTGLVIWMPVKLLPPTQPGTKVVIESES